MASLTLKAGDLEAQIVPEIGGSIARFDYMAASGPVPLLRGADATYTDVLNSACFPLVPFANRIRGGQFQCDGATVVLTPNMVGDISPLHGQGWRSAWTIVEARTSSLELVYHHSAGEWPWEYEAREIIRLEPDGMVVTLSCRNLSDRMMPCGLGLHPYYPCSATTILDTVVDTAWTVDSAVLPVAEVPATGHYDLRNCHICRQGLDNGFEGWSGEATITWPERQLSLVLSSADATRFQVYAPESDDVFVAEPVQNANTALNAPQEQWPALGISLLQRGQQSSMTAAFRVVHR